MTFPAPTDGLRLDLDALAELASALEPFAKVASLFKDRKPQHGDIIHAWEFTSGSAELRVSDCKRAADALALIDMARRAALPSEQTETEPLQKMQELPLDAKALEAAKEALYGRHERGFIMEPLIDPPDIGKAISVYLQNLPPQPPLGATPTEERLAAAHASYMDASLKGKSALDCMRAAARALGDRPGADRAGWQPIETAPKDGTYILAWDGFGYGVVCWDPDLAGTEAPSQWALYNRFATDALVPTHWQPLPASPNGGQP